MGAGGSVFATSAAPALAAIWLASTRCFRSDRGRVTRETQRNGCHHRISAGGNCTILPRINGSFSGKDFMFVFDPDVPCHSSNRTVRHRPTDDRSPLRHSGLGLLRGLRFLLRGRMRRLFTDPRRLGIRTVSECGKCGRIRTRRRTQMSRVSGPDMSGVANVASGCLSNVDVGKRRQWSIMDGGSGRSSAPHRSTSQPQIPHCGFPQKVKV